LEADLPLNCLWRARGGGANACQGTRHRVFASIPVQTPPTRAPPSPATWPGEGGGGTTAGAVFRKKKMFCWGSPGFSVPCRHVRDWRRHSAQ
jgi:hypothetical protein